MGKRLSYLITNAVLAACGLTATALAHHSFTATYDEKEQIAIEGTLVRFMYRNPHSIVHVLVEDEAGAKQRWAVEWGGASTLALQGVPGEILKPGDEVVITGNPGRNAIDHRMKLQTLRRTSDNYSWGTNLGEGFD